MTWCLVLLPDNVILYKDGQRQSIVPTETDVYSITAMSEDDSPVVKLSHRTLLNMRAADYSVLVCEPRAVEDIIVPVYIGWKHSQDNVQKCFSDGHLLIICCNSLSRTLLEY